MKVTRNSLILTPSDHIIFEDTTGEKHRIYWDIDQKIFVIEGKVDAEEFIDVNVTKTRNPTTSDDISKGIKVGMNWINSSNKRVWINIDNELNNSDWLEVTSLQDLIISNEKTWSSQKIKDELNLKSDIGHEHDSVNGHRITINTGDEPAEKDPFDLFITID